MKKIKFVPILTASLLLASCGGGSKVNPTFEKYSNETNLETCVNKFSSKLDLICSDVTEENIQSLELSSSEEQNSYLKLSYSNPKVEDVKEGQLYENSAYTFDSKNNRLTADCHSTENTKTTPDTETSSTSENIKYVLTDENNTYFHFDNIGKTVTKSNHKEDTKSEQFCSRRIAYNRFNSFTRNITGRFEDAATFPNAKFYVDDNDNLITVIVDSKDSNMTMDCKFQVRFNGKSLTFNFHLDGIYVEESDSGKYEAKETSNQVGTLSFKDVNINKPDENNYAKLYN